MIVSAGSLFSELCGFAYRKGELSLTLDEIIEIYRKEVGLTAKVTSTQTKENHDS